MRISIVLTVSGGLILLFGVLSRTCESIGISRKKGLFLLVCAAALSSFGIELPEGGTIFPACVLAPAWALGHTAKKSGRIGPALAALPLSAAMAWAAYPLAEKGGEWAIYALGLVSALPTLAFGWETGLTAAALTPVFAFTGAYISDLILLSWGSLELGEGCLSAQLAALMLTIPAVMLRNRIRTNVRKLSAARPTV